MSHNVYYRMTTGVTTSNGVKVSGVSSGSAITGATNGRTYYIIVTAVNVWGGESPASSEVSVTLPPTVLGNTYVLIVAGQSNAVGTAPLPMADAAVFAYNFPRTKIWSNGAWEDYNPYRHNQVHDLEPSTHGIEPYLIYLFDQNFPNATLYIIKFAEGGTSLGSDWSAPNGRLYAIFKTSYLLPALASADLANGYTPLGFWWMQGESDATSTSWADTYYNNLNGFFSSLVADIPATANFNRYIGRVKNHPSWTYRATVRAAQMQYCSISVNNAALIDTDTIDVRPTPSDQHYSALGYSQLAKVLFTSMTGIVVFKY